MHVTWRHTFIFFIALASLAIFFVTPQPAAAVMSYNATYAVSAPTASIGTPRQVHVDTDGRVFVLGTSTTTLAVISADGSAVTNVAFNVPIANFSTLDFVVSNGTLFIVVSGGSNLLYKYTVSGAVANQEAVVNLSTAGTSGISMGSDGRLYVSKSTSLFTFDQDLNQIAATSLLFASSRNAYDGVGRVVYFNTARRFYRSDLGTAGSNVLLGTISLNAIKGLAVSSDASSIYYADGTGSLLKFFIDGGVTGWTYSSNSGAGSITGLSGMDVNSSTGRITTIDSSGVIKIFDPINQVASPTAVASSSSAVLSWSSNVSDTDFRGVTIRRSSVTYPTSPTDGEAVTSTLTTSTFTDSALADGSYYYTLFNQTSDGYYSSGATSTVTIDSPPEAPALSAIVSGSTVSLSWSVPADTAYFRLQRSSFASPVSISDGVIVTSTAASITNLVQTSLEDGVHYYSIFARDASGNYSSAGTASVTVDTLPPNIYNVSAASASTSSIINWLTNEAGSSQVVYSLDTSYASSTTVTDAGAEVTVTHQVTVANVLPCTQYNYKAVSVDAALNPATSTVETFTTSGCAGNASISSATSTLADTSLTHSTSLTDGETTLALVVPAHFTTAHDQVTVQIKALNSTSVLNSLGKPSSALHSASSLVFDLKALADTQTTIDDFELPVRITFHYSDADIVGLTESTLWMYHHHDGVWSALDGCALNYAAKTISCNTSSFSTFGLFGETPSGGGGINYSVSSPGTGFYSVPQVSAGFPVAPLSLGPQGSQLEKKSDGAGESQPVQKPVVCAIPATLRLGSHGEPVKKLQTFLKNQGTRIYPEALVSGYFGEATKRAVIRFQEKYTLDILKPWGLVRGTGLVSKTTAAKICSLAGVALVK